MITHSTEVQEIATALAAAQAEFINIAKGQINTFFSNEHKVARYADIADFLAEVRGKLAKHAISVVQGPATTPDGMVTMTTMLLHKSGQWIRNELSAKPTKTDVQGLGSCITYLRRYSLTAICGIAANAEDDDGNGAAGNSTNGRGSTDGGTAPRTAPRSAAPQKPADTAKPATKPWDVLVADLKPRLDAIGETFASLREAIVATGAGHKVAEADPLKWDPSLFEGIKSWLKGKELAASKKPTGQRVDVQA